MNVALSPDDLARACADAMWKEDDASKGLGMKIVEIRPGQATMTMTVQPHMGLVFTVKAAVPDEPGLKNGEIFRGSVPYWVALLTAILVIISVPKFATWLPNLGNAVASK